MGERIMIELITIVFATGLAFVKGRSIIGWAIASALLGWFALIPLLIMRTKRDVVEQRSEKISDFVEGLEVEKEFRNINTVDDLMKTLEKPKG
jgi:hypothetical protein